MLKKVMIISGLFLYSSVGFSGELVKNVQLLEVASQATNGGKNFAVLINSGDGICAGTGINGATHNKLMLNISK